MKTLGMALTIAGREIKAIMDRPFTIPVTFGNPVPNILRQEVIKRFGRG